MRDTLKIFSLADTNVRLFSVYVCRDMCVCVCGEAGQAGCVASPSAKSLPTPTHNNPPQNYGFVVEDRPASLMHLKKCCVSVCECVCLYAFQHGGNPLSDGVSAARP